MLRECEKQHPLISAIVPIYNVEKYVRRCLDSLLHQTMKQIEVICIDDGSTDSSGVIANEYESNEFPRFRVIHTENRGLSATRNRGLDEAQADWIMFVDSDDWVDPDFCRIPYEAAIEYEADLVIFRASDCRTNGKIKNVGIANIPIGLVDEFTAHRFGGPVAWNKLYKKSLFNIIRYPEGHVYEDVATTYKIIATSEKTVLLPDQLYYPIKRKGSITHTNIPEYKRDRFKATQERYNYLISCGYPGDELTSSLYGAAIAYLASSSLSDDDLYNKAVDLMNEIISIPKTLSYKQKIGIFIWKRNKRLFRIMNGISRKVSYRHNIITK